MFSELELTVELETPAQEAPNRTTHDAKYLSPDKNHSESAKFVKTVVVCRTFHKVPI